MLHIGTWNLLKLLWMSTIFYCPDASSVFLLYLQLHYFSVIWGQKISMSYKYSEQSGQRNTTSAMKSMLLLIKISVFSHFQNSPSSTICCSPPLSPATTSLIWALSRALQIWSSLCWPAGSRLERRLEWKRWGSWGITVSWDLRREN